MERYSIDYSSHQMLKQGLLGSQGWSPSSSVCSSDSDSNDKQHAALSIHFPQPPFRLQPVLPLSVKKSRVVSEISAKDQAVIRGFDTWGFDKDGGDNVDWEQMDVYMKGLGIYTPEKAPKQPLRIDLPDFPRRVFSAPAPPAYLEILNGFDNSPEQEPDEYPFPIMPRPRHSFEMEEEEDKMQRLKDSLSLLQGDGDIGLSFDKMNMDEHPCRLVLSPEHQAPSLAEQMAFASGQGESYTWCSPSRRRSSFASYLPDSASSQQKRGSVSSQDERKMASRHVRQGVAANGSAPMPRSVSLQTALSGLEAEVGSSWSHKGCGDSDGGESSDEEQYWLKPADAVMDRSSFSQQSCMSSMIDSQDSSPIMHGVLSAHDFAGQSSGESDVDTPSTCATSVQSIDQGEKQKQVEGDFLVEGLPLQDSETSTVGIVCFVDSPNSLHEFSYLLDERPSPYTSPSAHNLADQSFNGDTFSPVLGSLNLADMPPTPIGFAPSPRLDQSSIEPHPSVMTESECPTLPLSFSCSSILMRPRPVPRLTEKTSFFGNIDDSLSSRQIMVKSKSVNSISGFRRPTYLPATTFKSLPNIPDRRSSLDATSLMSPRGSKDRKKSHRRGLSVSFVEEPLTILLSPSLSDHQVESPASISTSTSRMSSKALDQIREACRAKFQASDRMIDKRDASASANCLSACSYSSSVSDKARVNLPTLLVARTRSQRQRGWTGVAETEPHVLAMAKLGVQTKVSTRQSKVEALMNKPDLLEQGVALLDMPKGVILVVEEKQVLRQRFSYV